MMIDYPAALALSQLYAARLSREGGIELVVWELATVERPVGWVFFLQSRDYLSTGDGGAVAIGVAPLLVDRRDGSLHRLETGTHWSQQLDE